MPNYIVWRIDPFLGIDRKNETAFADLRKKGYGILLTDHNVRETLAITDRTYLMYEGKIFLEGPPEVITNDPSAKKYYLGERFEW